VLDLGTHQVETPDAVAARIRRALPYVQPEHLAIAPDCGLKYLPRESAVGKMRAMIEGARLVRSELLVRGRASVNESAAYGAEVDPGGLKR
jgi:5-methyltetrahydropteroyltriglutamate--homocysteine methyltransferase